MQFSEILGKEEVKKQLIMQVEKSRIPHAQILLSKEGYGGLAMALAFASYILCENKINGDSCGSCNQCLKTKKFIHPDLHFSFPVVKFGSKERKDTTSDDFLPAWRTILKENPYMGTNQWLSHIEAENNLPNINVKECNNIIQKLNMMSYESDYKILIMWLPEFLGPEGNRLLKLIEEPTDNTFLIFVSENQETILQTILSRCQLIKIPPFENNEIARFLESKLDIPSHKSQQIANLADGNINLAISIGKNEATDYSDLLIKWLRTAYKSDPCEINDWISVVSALNKDEQKNFFEYALHFFRQFVFHLLAKNENVNLTEKELDIVQKMKTSIDVKKSESISDLLNEAIENLNRNVNIKILLFADTLTIGDIIKTKTLE